jgi:hypothetical protein
MPDAFVMLLAVRFLYLLCYAGAGAGAPVWWRDAAAVAEGEALH